LQANFADRGLRTLYIDVEKPLMRSLPESDALVGSPVCTEAAPAGGSTACKLPRHQMRGQDSLLRDFEAEQLEGAEAREPMPLTRVTAYSLSRAAEVHHYKYIIGENVPEFVSRWPGFRGWVQDMNWRGYRFYIVSADAAHIAPTADLRSRSSALGSCSCSCARTCPPRTSRCDPNACACATSWCADGSCSPPP
jgi:DNA (cytosine-5)-methyltransferase 1